MTPHHPLLVSRFHFLNVLSSTVDNLFSSQKINISQKAYISRQNTTSKASKHFQFFFFSFFISPKTCARNLKKMKSPFRNYKFLHKISNPDPKTSPFTSPHENSMENEKQIFQQKKRLKEVQIGLCKPLILLDGAIPGSLRIKLVSSTSSCAKRLERYKTTIFNRKWSEQAQIRLCNLLFSYETEQIQSLSQNHKGHEQSYKCFCIST